MLDLFAGTGALAFEALSRGAREAVLVERDARVLKVLGQSACELGLRERCRLIKRDLLRGRDAPDTRADIAERIASFAEAYTLVFADPPTPTSTRSGRCSTRWPRPARSHRTPWSWSNMSMAALPPHVSISRSRPPIGMVAPACCCYATRPPDLAEHERTMSHAIYPGSFDPITNGHMSILKSGLVSFEKITVAVLNNEKKQPLFTVAERIELIKASAASAGLDVSRIEVDSFDGLLVEYARAKGVNVILRGLRAVSDFEYELQMANMNRHLNEGIVTTFIMANDVYFYVASGLVKEVSRLGGDITKLVPGPVAAALREKLGL